MSWDFLACVINRSLKCKICGSWGGRAAECDLKVRNQCKLISLPLLSIFQAIFKILKQLLHAFFFFLFFWNSFTHYPDFPNSVANNSSTTKEHLVLLLQENCSVCLNVQKSKSSRNDVVLFPKRGQRYNDGHKTW